MKKILIFCLILSIFLITSCGTISDDQRSSDGDIDTLITETSTELSMNNLLMTIKCWYPHSQVEGTFFLMCVLSCGDVWAITYSKDDKLYHKFDIGDESVWSLSPAPDCLGRLEASEIAMFPDYFSKIDRNSEYVSPEVMTEAIDYAYYSIVCYLPLENGGREPYHILFYGDVNEPAIEEMKDANALAALEIIRSSKLYGKWLETHTHFKWQPEDEWLET